MPIASAANSADIPLDQRRSGYLDLGRDTKAMQDDDSINPATLWVLDGETLWNQKAGAANRACADCHQDATASMKGVAARYPHSARRAMVRSISNSASTCVAPNTNRRSR